MIPESHREFLEKPYYAVLSTVMPDGQPQSTVIWFDYDGEYININSAKGRQKDKNIRANPKVTLAFVDQKTPFHWLEVRGTVVEITEEGAVDHIDRLATRYTGKPAYYGYVTPEEVKAKEVRVSYRIRLDRVLAFPMPAR